REFTALVDHSDVLVTYPQFVGQRPVLVSRGTTIAAREREPLVVLEVARFLRASARLAKRRYTPTHHEGERKVFPSFAEPHALELALGSRRQVAGGDELPVHAEDRKSVV